MDLNRQLCGHFEEKRNKIIVPTNVRRFSFEYLRRNKITRQFSSQKGKKVSYKREYVGSRIIILKHCKFCSKGEALILRAVPIYQNNQNKNTISIWPTTIKYWILKAIINTFKRIIITPHLIEWKKSTKKREEVVKSLNKIPGLLRSRCVFRWSRKKENQLSWY